MVLAAVRGLLLLTVASRGFSSLLVCGLIPAVASLREHRLQAHKLW